MSRSRTPWVVGLAVSVVAVALYAADPLAQLGLSQADARENVMNAITAGDFPYGNVVAAFKKLPAGARSALVTDAIGWSKAYVSSAEFRAAYTRYRAMVKPEPPQFAGTVDEEFKGKQAKLAADLAGARRTIASLPADQRKELEEVVAHNEALMNQPENQAVVRGEIVAERADAQEGYERSVKDWQVSYPENPQVLVARRLQRFMTASANVDFSAPLVSRDGAMRFVNPQYEQQSSDWKLCFRAGRDIVAAARTAAGAWLKEVENAK